MTDGRKREGKREKARETTENPWENALLFDKIKNKKNKKALQDNQK